MQDWLKTFHGANQAFPAIEIAVKVAVALALGLLVGFEREWSNKDIGVRTFAMTALLGLLATLLSPTLLFVRAQKAEQKAEDIQHALNRLLNLGFERFHMGSTPDGAVHYFELGNVRNPPAADGRDLPAGRGKTRARRIVLWRTTFPKDTSMPQYSTGPNSSRCL